MKQVFKDKIINIDTNIEDNKFLIEKLEWEDSLASNENFEVIFLGDLLEKRKNDDILEKVRQKPAMWGNVYSSKDELEIFKELFDFAIRNNKKIHIVWITLDEEIKILEKYYESLWFFSEDINCFEVDFSVPLVTVSVKIENIMYRGSDYKRLRDKIFFNPPIRESGQVKAMFKWITRWVTAWIYIKDFSEEVREFLQDQIITEHILAVNMAKVLNYNLAEIWFFWEKHDFIIKY